MGTLLACVNFQLDPLGLCGSSHLAADLVEVLGHPGGVDISFLA